MTEFWEANFQDKHMLWGEEPAVSAIFARDYFLGHNVKEVLIPGIGYGRNAKPFLESGMHVTGIEISETAIDLARAKMKLDIPIHHGSVSDMPFDDAQYDGIFCYALIHLLDDSQRRKLIEDCYRQLKPGGYMIFTAISKNAPAYGKGTQLGPDRFELFEGAPIYFYDAHSAQQEFGDFGLVEISDVDEPARNHSTTTPFLTIVCRKTDSH